MNNPKMMIRMTDEQIKENPFITAEGRTPFYSFIGEKFAGSYDDVKSIDCRKVNVARNIQNSWFEYAKENGITVEDLNMMLLFSGPKALDEIPDNLVELEENAIEY